MKSTLTILLLVVMLVQSFSKVWIVLDYQANKNYIAEFLCVNKAKPQMHCQGHCYLKKQLAKAEEAQKKSTNQNQKFEITLFCQNLFRVTFIPAFKQNSFQAFKSVFYLFSAQLNYFHPPQVLVKLLSAAI
ncbi:hypothetical protein [Adhaeribacter radiodurans]|uniref:Uncharacterized protein n=1 Tax=Adhaeribacter radiodurans TaxID=2745197 RepID=A0A7L7L8R0_9BACT|nr:hypothetical protein [Adhaeribacter radiodurans]QMU29123.1 hypothetical protein HUW48_14210 [Adhaeribacter radiodurans]